MKLPQKQLDEIIETALSEDVSHGDVTSKILIPPQQLGKAYILSKEEGVLAGIEIAKRVFLKIDPALDFQVLKSDGNKIKPGEKVAAVFGNVASILKAERVALNFLQHLSGIASQTAKYLAKTEGLSVNITDTRKTIPGLRLLEKYAVQIGGGQNHRFHLGDGVLIKDNHIAALRALGLSLKEIIAKAKKKAPKGLELEVEVGTTKEAQDAAEAGADIIMLDNMSPDEMRKAVSLLPSHIKTEASGGINLDNVRTIAETGVDRISIGALTHSAEALDLSLELEPQTLKLI